MKRYIIAKTEVDIDTSMFDGTPFKCDTDTSYYNDFLNTRELEYMRSAKNRDGKIVMMSPREYFNECATNIFSRGTTVEELKASREYDKELNAEYREAMQNGAKFPLCYLNYADSGQEGLHRMMLAGDLYGWDTKFPVLVITVYDQDVESERKILREINDFKRHDFDRICEQSADNISNWREPIPDNYVDQLRAEVIQVARDYDADIDVEVEIDEVDGEPRALVYLTEFDWYKLDGRYEPEEIWLSRYFNITGEPATLDDPPLDDIDYSELDIDGLLGQFFK